MKNLNSFIITFALSAAFILLTLFTSSGNSWKPYPITANLQYLSNTSRIECSVYDSVLNSTQFYYTSYFTGFHDTTNSSNEVIIYKRYVIGNPNQYDADYGFIIYDPILHQFAEKIKSHPDPFDPAAYMKTRQDKVIEVRYCCEVDFGTYIGYDIDTYVNYYDLNLHAWKEQHVMSGNNYDGPSINLNFVDENSFTRYYNDDEWNPTFAYYFHDPNSHHFSGSGMYDCTGYFGNQDLLVLPTQQFLSNDIEAISFYGPGPGSFSGVIIDEDGTQIIDNGFIYIHKQTSGLRYFLTYNDYTQQLLFDTISTAITQVNVKNKVIAYADVTANQPTVHVQVLSPVTHTWHKDSVVSPAGIFGLNINFGTVTWSDSNMVMHKVGYDSNVGWGNFDTPPQLNPFVYTTYPVTGVPLVFVRDNSIGAGGSRILFGDGDSTLFGKGSAWHQYKINGAYDGTGNVNYSVCLEAYTSLGLLTQCSPISFFTTSSAGSITTNLNLICAGDSARLVASVYNGSLVWQENNGVNGWQDLVNTYPSADTIFVSPLLNSWYRLKAIDTNSAPSFSNIEQIKVCPAQMTSVSFGNDTVCKGSVITLDADSVPGIISYNWVVPSGWQGNSTSSSLSVLVNGTSGMVSVSANTICGTTTTFNYLYTVTDLNPQLYWDGYEFSTSWTATPGVDISWIDCSTMQIVQPNDHYYVPNQSGTYAAIVEAEGCIDTSDCMFVSLTGLNDLSESDAIIFSPNPAQNELIIHNQNFTEKELFLVIYNSFGQVCKREYLHQLSKNSRKALEISELASGLYTIEITSHSSKFLFRFLKL